MIPLSIVLNLNPFKLFQTPFNLYPIWEDLHFEYTIMQLNPNDIFEQIGLVVDNSPHKNSYSFEETSVYTVFLEI